MVVVLVSAMLHGPSDRRLQWLRKELPIDRRTLKRWLEWWTGIFVETAFWKAARGRFARLLIGALMPLELVEVFGAHQIEGLVKLMKFLSPITTATYRLGVGM